MDTLSISKKLLAVGFKQEQAEVVAEIIKSREDEMATKKDIKDLRWLTITGFIVMGAGFGYVVSLLNTLIGKI